MKFSGLKYHFQTAAAVGLAWAPTLYLMNKQLGSGGTAAVSAAFAAASVAFYSKPAQRYFDKVYNEKFQKDYACTPAPPELQEIVDRIARTAETDAPVSAHILPEDNKGGNAGISGNHMYFSQEFTQDMDKRNLEFIVGHEISHLKSKDMEERFLFAMPRLYSALTATYAAFLMFDTVVDVIQGSQNSAHLKDVVPVFNLYLSNYFLQSMTYNALRRRNEYRADKNAVMLTGDPEGAMDAMSRLDQGGRHSILIDPFKSHPDPQDRLARIKNAIVNGGQKPS